MCSAQRPSPVGPVNSQGTWYKAAWRATCPTQTALAGSAASVDRRTNKIDAVLRADGGQTRLHLRRRLDLFGQRHGRSRLGSAAQHVLEPAASDDEAAATASGQDTEPVWHTLRQVNDVARLGVPYGLSLLNSPLTKCPGRMSGTTCCAIQGLYDPEFALLSTRTDFINALLNRNSPSRT